MKFLKLLQLLIVTVFFPVVVLMDVVLWNIAFGSAYGYVNPKHSFKTLSRQLCKDWKSLRKGV